MKKPLKTETEPTNITNQLEQLKQLRPRGIVLARSALHIAAQPDLHW